MSSQAQGERANAKIIVAANPWPLAARAKAAGLATKGRFYEADIPGDLVYVIDLDAFTGWLGNFAARFEARELPAGGSPEKR